MNRSAHILIVDDDAQTVEYLRDLLEMHGYETSWAFSGVEALDLLRADLSVTPDALPFDLILLDVMLPEIDGYEVCRRIKSNPVWRHIPIIMLTGLGSTQSKTRGLEVGADDYVTKPFKPEELVARVKAGLRIRRMEEELIRRNRELAILNEVASIVSSSLLLEQVLPQTLDHLLQVLGIMQGLIALHDQRRSTFRLQVYRGVSAPRTEALHWSREHSTLGQVAAKGEPEIRSMADAPDLRELFPDQPYGFFVPLVSSSGQTVGVMVLGATEDLLDRVRLEWLQALGNHIGTAVENARLYAELRAYTEELARSQEQLVQTEKLAAMGRLAASIAHELNNPLQAVQNCLHLILRRMMPMDRKEQYLVMAQEEVERLIGIVQRMLEFYRPTRGQPAEADLNALVEGVLALAQKRIQHGKVQVHTRLDPNLPPVPVVEGQIKQVFLNLVINAVEAMPEGGDLYISSELSPDGEWVLVHFVDTGVGLTQEEIKRIFEPFYTTKSKGTGLGLAVSYGIIERHGGSIEVQSVKGEGARFTVRLPRRPVAWPEDEPALYLRRRKQ